MLNTDHELIIYLKFMSRSYRLWVKTAAPDLINYHIVMLIIHNYCNVVYTYCIMACNDKIKIPYHNRYLLLHKKAEQRIAYLGILGFY